MNFWKSNSYDIVRLFINQMGIMIFSLVMYCAVELVNIDKSNGDLTLLIAISVFSTIFYFALIYSACWEYGAKDKIRIESNKMEFVHFKGARLALFANLPNFALATLGLLCMLIYVLSSIEAFYTVFGVVNLVLRFICSMYLGIVQGTFASMADNIQLYYSLQTAAFAILPLVSVAVCQFGYEMGMKEKKLFYFLKK